MIINIGHFRKKKKQDLTLTWNHRRDISLVMRKNAKKTKMVEIVHSYHGLDSWNVFEFFENGTEKIPRS